VSLGINSMTNNIVYTVTVLDLRANLPLGFRSTPMICTNLDDAIYSVKNNFQDLSDGCTYQYAVIEKSKLNEIRPNLEVQSLRLWYKYNSIKDEFEPCDPPRVIRNQTGFGIG
jgi:hypothetical protein